MAFDQYTGGPMAALARALSSAGQGYEESIDDRLKRAQETVQTQNQTADPILAFLNAHPGASYQQAVDYVSAARGGKVPPVPANPSSIGPNVPAMPGGLSNAPVPAPAPVPNPDFTPAPIKPFGPSGGLGAIVGPPAKIAAPVPLPPPPAVPPAPVPASVPAVSGGLTPADAPSASIGGAWSPPPPAPNSMVAAKNAQLAGLQASIDGTPVPAVPKPVPAAVQAVPPVPPPAPGGQAVAVPQQPVPANPVPPANPAPPPAPVPIPGQLPWTQRPLRDVVGPSEQEQIWGIRTAPQNARNALLAQHYGDQATNQFWNQVDKYSQDPTAQMSIAEQYDRKYNTTDFTDSIKNGTGSTDMATHRAAQDTNATKLTDARVERMSFLDSKDEADQIKRIGDLQPGFQQTTAVQNWNTAHPSEKLPVPDGVTVPYYQPGQLEQSVIGMRTQQAALLGEKSKYYPDYINAIVGKDQAEQYLATQRGIAVPLEVQNQIQRTAQQGAYQSGLLRLGNARVGNDQQRMNLLMRNNDYRTLYQQDASLRNQIDLLNKQKETAMTQILDKKKLAQFLSGTDVQIQDLQQRQYQVEQQRAAIETNTQTSTPAATVQADTSLPQTTALAGFQQPPVPTRAQPAASGGWTVKMNGSGATILRDGQPTGLTVDAAGNVFKNGHPTGHRIKLNG